MPTLSTVEADALELEALLPEAPADDVPLYDSDRRLPAALEELVGLYRFRDLVLQLIRCDVVSRYKRSYLGVVWTLLNPLGTTLVLVIALGAAFGTSRPEYAVHAMTGLMVWNFLASGTVNAIGKLLTGSRQMPGVNVPRTVYAAAAIGTALVNLVLATVPVALLVLAVGAHFGPGLATLPVAIVLLGLFGLGVSLLVSSVSVRFADVAQTFVLALPAWMYLTPIIYPASVLPAAARTWLPVLNPLCPLVELYRAPFTAAGVASVDTFALATLGTAITLLAGWLAFAARTDELGRIA